MLLRASWAAHPASRAFKPGTPQIAVYYHAMGLFRSRAKKVREKAAAELPREPTTVTAEAVVAHAHRETTAEARPNPDQPGWGRSIGQQIGRANEGRASQD